MSDLGWEIIDRGDWSRNPIKPMPHYKPGTTFPDHWQQGSDEPEEKS